ncbi:MAG: beta-lactamase family protein [Pyrinomonadaceae bacterium]|nr:beta-lactamase family protein [Pyrinomonadaceae bacterium]
MASKKVDREQPGIALDDLFNLDRNALPIDPRIDEIVNQHLYELGAHLKPKNRDRVPGAAVAVRKDNKVVHLNCYGYANLETGAKITPDTIFDLGSLSKQFTALAVLDLINRKKLDLNDRLSKFFKEFPRYADDITVEDLIHHTSALPDYVDIYVESRRAEKDWYDAALAKPDEWYPKMLNRKKEITNKDVLKWIAAHTLLPRPPDTEFMYSNSGYVVLAELVRKVTRKRFASLVKGKLFGQFGMKHTYVFDEVSNFSDDAPEVVNHARCYNRVNGQGFVPVGYTPMNFITGDGNVHSTIVDMAIWENLLNALDNLSSSTYFEGFREALWRPAELKNRKRVDYGWGWNLLHDKYEVKDKSKRVTRKYESRAEYHRGVWLAWRSYVARGSRWVVPKTGKSVDPNTFESLGIVVLSNNNQFNTCRIAQDISRLYWGPLKKDNIMNNFNCG